MSNPKQYSVLNPYIFFAIYASNIYQIKEGNGDIIQRYDNESEFPPSSKEIIEFITCIMDKYEEKLEEIKSRKVNPIAEGLNHNYLDQIYNLTKEIDSKDDAIDELKKEIESLKAQIQSQKVLK